MTLKEWTERNNVSATPATAERNAVSVIVQDHDAPYRRDLWHLSDYVVSSVSGVVVWLVPRSTQAKHTPERCRLSAREQDALAELSILMRTAGYHWRNAQPMSPARIGDQLIDIFDRFDGIRWDDLYDRLHRTGANA